MALDVALGFGKPSNYCFNLSKLFEPRLETVRTIY